MRHPPVLDVPLLLSHTNGARASGMEARKTNHSRTRAKAKQEARASLQRRVVAPAEAQQAPAAQEAMEAQKVPAVPAMEAQKVPAVQVARKKEMKTPRRRSGRRKNIGRLCTMPEGRPLESDPQKTSECRRCIESSDVWKQCLTPNNHGCSACKKVIEASAWNERKIKAHPYFSRALVWPSCAKRGYAPSKYDEHQCDECLAK